MTTKKIIDASFAVFQSSRDGTTSRNPKIHTGVDDQVNSTLAFQEIADRMIDIDSNFSRLQTFITDKWNASERQKKQFFTALKFDLVPFIHSCAIRLNSSASLLSPIAGISYDHYRNKTKRKHDTIKESEYVSPATTSSTHP